MWDSKSRRQKHGVFLDSPPEEATKLNPYQPPWIRKVRAGITLVIGFTILAVVFYIFSTIGERIPDSIAQGKSRLEGSGSLQREIRGNPVSNPASSNAVPVIAARLSGAPGAIVCRDFQTVSLVFRLYNQSLEDRLQDALTKGAATSIRGPSAAEPDPASFGCVLAPDGTPLLKEVQGIVPRVTVRLADGSFFQGITMSQMLKSSTSK